MDCCQPEVSQDTKLSLQALGKACRSQAQTLQQSRTTSPGTTSGLEWKPGPTMLKIEGIGKLATSKTMFQWGQFGQLGHKVENATNSLNFRCHKCQCHLAICGSGHGCVSLCCFCGHPHSTKSNVSCPPKFNKLVSMSNVAWSNQICHLEKIEKSKFAKEKAEKRRWAAKRPWGQRREKQGRVITDKQGTGRVEERIKTSREEYSRRVKRETEQSRSRKKK